jgi:hypothetical protein
MLLGNLQLMDNNELRIVKHTHFYPKDGVSSSAIWTTYDVREVWRGILKVEE